MAFPSLYGINHGIVAQHGASNKDSLSLTQPVVLHKRV